MANQHLLNQRKKQFNLSCDTILPGVFLPFHNTSNFESNTMVRIIQSDFACFNTKKRVPYKIVIETVE